MANVSIGESAPDFTLRDESNQEVRLSSLRGAPVVLVFYPADFSPICTNELCGIRDDFSAFEAKGAKVFGISRDSTWAHKAFKDREGLTHSLLADMKGEVARLYGGFREHVRAQFEGDIALQIHLSPQFLPDFLARRDPITGRLGKWTLGAWMFPLLGLLARFKFLRGTPFDPAGRTAHRLRERALITEYEATLMELLEGLTPERHDLAVAIARIPESIRGFDTVKERHIEEAKAQEAELLAAFRQAP